MLCPINMGKSLCSRIESGRISSRRGLCPRIQKQIPGPLTALLQDLPFASPFLGSQRTLGESLLGFPDATQQGPEIAVRRSPLRAVDSTGGFGGGPYALGREGGQHAVRDPRVFPAEGIVQHEQGLEQLLRMLPRARHQTAQGQGTPLVPDSGDHQAASGGQCEETAVGHPLDLRSARQVRIRARRAHTPNGSGRGLPPEGSGRRSHRQARPGHEQAVAQPRIGLLDQALDGGPQLVRREVGGHGSVPIDRSTAWA